MPAETDDAHTLKGFAGAGEWRALSVSLMLRKTGILLRRGNFSDFDNQCRLDPAFPRAAAIITDVGAPLSHAAIVARELGFPPLSGAEMQRQN